VAPSGLIACSPLLMETAAVTPARERAGQPGRAEPLTDAAEIRRS